MPHILRHISTSPKAFVIPVSGQSMVEYGLVVVLIAVVSILALTQLGQSISSNLATEQKNKISASAIAGTPYLQPVTSPIQSTPNTPLSSSPSIPGKESVCLTGGMCLNIPVVEEQSMLQTAGANGGSLTLGYSDVLTQIAEQLKNDPNSDPNVAQLITNLANVGHQVGDKETTLTNSCLSGQTCLLPLGSIPNQVDAIQSAQEQFQSAQNNLSSYLASNPTALPTSVQAIINQQAQNITAIAGSYTSASRNEIKITSSVLIKSTQQNWTISGDPKITHQSANTICSQNAVQGKCMQ